MIEDMFPDHAINGGDSGPIDLKQMVLFLVLMVMLIVVVLAMPPNMQAAGNNIYVASGGSNNNSGTIDKPLKTIQAAVDRARPGDTVRVRGGTYVEAVRITRSGTSSNPITIRAFTGETPVIDGRAGVDCLNCGLPDGEVAVIDPKTGRGFKWNQLVSIQSNHISFEGFVVKRSMGRGITVRNDDSMVTGVTLRNNQINDSRHAGILLTAENSLIENNVVWHSGSFAPWVDGRGASVGWPVALRAVNSDHVTVRGNTVYENWSEGFGAGFSTNITVEDNSVFDNFALQIYVHRVENMTVQRNLTYHTNNPEWRRGGDPSDCIVVNNESQFSGNLVTKNIDIVNNIAAGCKSNFAVWGNQGQELSSDNFLVAHNTFVNAVTNHSDDKAKNVSFANDDYRNFKFENNVVYQGKTSDGHDVGSADPKVSFANNLWYPYRTEDGDGSGPGDIVGRDPQFADPRAYLLPENWPQQPSRFWFQVKSNSPVIDTCEVSQSFFPDTDIIIDLFFGIRDSIPDMGIHEYGSLPSDRSYIPLIGK